MIPKIFIIAEAGVNHNGSLDIALKLIRAAADAGADAIKFQTFRADQVATARAKMTAYQVRNTGIKISQLDMLRKLELPEHFYPPLIQECRKKHILFLSTPHGGRDSVELLESLNISMYKIGSGDLTNYILLSRVSQTHKPIIVSSGMASLKEIQDSIRFLRKNRSGPISVLHCTTNYPCLPHEVHLRAMQTLMDALDVPVGYSDHTTGVQAAIMAATLGATIYECHVTIDKALPGPDHRASSDPKELKQKIDAIRTVEIMLGSPEKKPTKNEKDMTLNIRKSIVSTADLPKGHTVCFDDVEAKRPGNGLSPEYFQKLIGRRLNRDIQKDEQILMKDTVGK